MSETSTLQMKRVIKAKRERVFAAWIQPELMRQWFAPGAMAVAEVETGARPGGTYRIAMEGDNGSGKCVSSRVSGVYQTMIPNELLRFTWGWVGNTAPETVVTVEFKDVEGGTEVTLTHEGFENEDARGKHEHGWRGCLDKLERVYDPAPTLQAAVR